MNLNKRIRRILALSITSLVLILLMAVPIAASGIPESSGILESLGIVESSDIIDSSDILESSGNPESPAVQESLGESESPTIQESSEESESPTVQESLDYLETSTDPEISADPGVPDDPETEGKLEVHFINVGQGNATLIRCDGHSMLIDGGAPGDTGLIAYYLETHGVTQLDYIVVTHGDSDHVDGLPDAVDSVEGNIDTVIAPYRTHNVDTFIDFTDHLADNNISITVPHRGDVYDLGPGAFTIISTGGWGNNDSMILRFVYGNTSFLFTGDAPASELETVMGYGYELRSTVLMVPHHGSSKSAYEEFFRAVTPSVAVISSGINSFGHPSKEILSLLQDAGATVVRTDNNGDVLMTSYGDYVLYSAERRISQYENLMPSGSTHSLYKGTETESGGEKEREPEGGVADESVSGSEGESGSGRSVESDSSSESECISISEGESDSRHSGESVSESRSESGSGGESGTSEETHTYVINKSTKKFHYPECSRIIGMKSSNRKEVTTSRKKLMDVGYDPCCYCIP